MSDYHETIRALGKSVLASADPGPELVRLQALANDGAWVACHYLGLWLSRGTSSRDINSSLHYLLVAAQHHPPSLLLAQAQIDRLNSSIDLLNNDVPDSGFDDLDIGHDEIPEHGFGWQLWCSTFLSRVAFLRAGCDLGLAAARPLLACEYVKAALGPTKSGCTPLQESIGFSVAVDVLRPLYASNRTAFAPGDEILENEAVIEKFDGLTDLLARTHVAMLIDFCRPYLHLGWAALEFAIPDAADFSVQRVQSAAASVGWRSKAKAIDTSVVHLNHWFRVTRTHADIIDLILEAEHECRTLLNEDGPSFFEDHIIANVLLAAFRFRSYFHCHQFATPWRGLLYEKGKADIVRSRYRRVFRDNKIFVGYRASRDADSYSGRMFNSSSESISNLALSGPLCIHQTFSDKRTDTHGSAVLYASPFNIKGTSSYSSQMSFDFGCWVIDDDQSLRFLWIYSRNSPNSASRRADASMSLGRFETNAAAHPLGAGLLHDKLQASWAAVKPPMRPFTLGLLPHAGSGFERQLSTMSFLHLQNLSSGLR